MVVPAYNASATIRHCLEALVGQSGPELELEIIVADDGSTDNTTSVVEGFVRQHKVHLLRLEHGGAARARNKGVQAVDPAVSIILFTDADCVPDTRWALTLIKRLQQAGPQIAGVKGIYKTRQSEPVARFVQQEFEERYARFDKETTEIDFCDTYSAAYRREILLKNPFDENLPGAVVEDAELGWRLRNLNYRFVFEPGAIVYHFHPATIGDYFRRKFRIGRWRVGLYADYPRRLRTDSHTSQSAKLQMLLTGIVLACAGLAVACRLVNSKIERALPLFGFYPAWLIGGLAEVWLQLSFKTFLTRVRLSDPELLGTAWLMLQLRAIALGSGAAFGLLLALPDLVKKLAGFAKVELTNEEPEINKSLRPTKRTAIKTGKAEN